MLPSVRSLLLIVQVALSVAVLLGAVLLARNLGALRAIDFGFEPEGLTLATVYVQPGAGTDGVESISSGIERWNRLIDALETLPGRFFRKRHLARTVGFHRQRRADGARSAGRRRRRARSRLWRRRQEVVLDPRHTDSAGPWVHRRRPRGHASGGGDQRSSGRPARDQRGLGVGPPAASARSP